MKDENTKDEIIENCQLEYHRDRGVLYVHNKNTGATVLRISNIKLSRFSNNLDNEMLDLIIGQSEGRIKY